ncbi:MAG: hypothetical protein U0Y82_07995 [Thermoleophilia bacterium]
MTGRFDPTAVGVFAFTHRHLDASGLVRLGYALDDIAFEERIQLPVPEGGVHVRAAEPLLDLLHWVAGVSYFKAAIPPRLDLGERRPGPATAALLEALYRDGLGEFAVVNDLPQLPSPTFPSAPSGVAGPAATEVHRVLVPVGGGKDSAVALELVRASGLPFALFSVGDAPPIRGTAEVAGVPRLVARRTLDPALLELNRHGALNGHIPITAIVTCIALLTAAINGFDTVAMANERSASAGNVAWHEVEVNHQFSKSLRAERLMAAALAERASGMRAVSVLRPASELAIARAFARLPRYHPVFTSCNRVFHIDPAVRRGTWCADCDKCRFVFLILAPFLSPEALRGIFGADMLDQPDQYAGFAQLTATGGHKPFECVGEVEESVAAIRMIAARPEWRDHRVVARLAAEVLPRFGPHDGDPARILPLSDDHLVPEELMGAVRALLGS